MHDVQFTPIDLKLPVYNMKINNSATKLSDAFQQNRNSPKGSKFKVKGFRPALHLLECPWAQCSDYKLEESTYKSAFRTFKVIHRTQIIRPTAHIMRDKESLRRSLFLRRQFDKKNGSSEKRCARVVQEKKS